MTERKRIDELIEEGWDVLYKGMDNSGFQIWQLEAMRCLTELLGADHSYTQSFKSCVQDRDELSLLIGGGILTAAKEETEKEP